MHSRDKTLLSIALLHFVLQSQICLLFQVSLDFLLLHSSPHDEKDTFFFLFCLVLEDLVGLHRTVPIHLQHSGWGIDLDYYDIEWFALATNRDHFMLVSDQMK